MLGNFQVCISVPLIIAEWRPGLRVGDSVYSEAGPRGTIRVGWLNLQPLRNGFSARALGGFWSDGHAGRVGHSHGPCMGLGGYLGLFWALAGIACARVVTCIPLASPVYDCPRLWYQWGPPNIFLCSHSTNFAIDQNCS